MASDFISIIGTVALTKFTGPAFEDIGKAAWERAKQLGKVAYQHLTAVGREPTVVDPKTLIPLVQAASLETDATIAYKWAALLANAADPVAKVQVEPGYIEVLRQLTPADAQVLELLYRTIRPDDRDALYWESAPIRTEGMAEQLGLSLKQFAICIDTLIRLRLCAVPTPRRERKELLSITPAAAYQVCPTMSGREFLLACTPPTE